MFAVTISSRYWALKIEYEITKNKIIILNNEDKLIYNELSIDEISKFKVKKTIFDLKEQDTGSIYFYNLVKKNPSLTFKHINNVTYVSNLLEKIIPTSKSS